MRAKHSIPVIAISVSAASAALWGVALAGIWDRLPGAAMDVTSNGAAATLVIAVMCWVLWSARRRRDAERARDAERWERVGGVQLDAIELLTRPAAVQRRTGPLRLV
jgi:uncharacterized protein (TIGR03382 family)